MLLAEVSDTVAIINAVFTGVVAVLIAVLNSRARKADLKADLVATNLATSTRKTADKLDSMAAVGVATHLLCNSAMLAQKRLLATSARALANKTGDAVDLAAADVAEKELRDHERKQLEADRDAEGRSRGPRDSS